MSEPEENPDIARYLAALHGLQSGVAWEMGTGTSAATEPKHLRVGVNSALIQQSAIVKLLVAAGIFTMEEWWKTLADEMEAEVKRYQDRANEAYGRPGVIRFK